MYFLNKTWVDNPNSTAAKIPQTCNGMHRAKWPNRLVWQHGCNRLRIGFRWVGAQICHSCRCAAVNSLATSLIGCTGWRNENLLLQTSKFSICLTPLARYLAFQSFTTHFLQPHRPPVPPVPYRTTVNQPPSPLSTLSTHSPPSLHNYSSNPHDISDHTLLSIDLIKSCLLLPPRSPRRLYFPLALSRRLIPSCRHRRIHQPNQQPLAKKRRMKSIKSPRVPVKVVAIRMTARMALVAFAPSTVHVALQLLENGRNSEIVISEHWILPV